MTIDKAIERLQSSIAHNTVLITRGDIDAIKLGIEALKRFKEVCAWEGDTFGRPLPGETVKKE